MSSESEKEAKLSVLAHVLCGWPILLATVGGIIGGVLGVAAYTLNVSIYKSEMPRRKKVIQNLLSGFGAFVAWLVFATVMTGLSS
ncbi:hypothetical protein [Pseudomonas sp. GD03944]|uniref:hypothetical protein n=1 Tax=Pseudomonas sp. GD03944 TaxID=2975409 RepID=UPI00244CFFEE|nr:hypothetical protein [Pseudomonas sp. GD03944]MDH1265026.1 hypothetical protein [Pseudomonas sp. GD03944]